MALLGKFHGTLLLLIGAISAAYLYLSGLANDPLAATQAAHQGADLLDTILKITAAAGLGGGGVALAAKHESATAAKVLAILLLPLLVLGCNTAQPVSPLGPTPIKQYQTASDRYYVVAYGLAFAEATGKIPPETWAKIQKAETAYAGNFALAAQWIQQNPTAATTPGVQLPYLDLLSTAITGLQAFGVGIPPIPPLPTLPVPTTGPALPAPSATTSPAQPMPEPTG